MYDLDCKIIKESLFGLNNNMNEYFEEKEKMEILRDYILKNCSEIVQKLYSGVELRGTYEKGTGKASLFLSDPFYAEKIKEMLNGNFFPGTLNIRVNKNFKNLLTFLKYFPSFSIKGNKWHGSVYIHRCRIFDEECLILFPEKSAYEDTVEIVSKKKLSEYYDMQYGNEYTINVFVKF
ncbi:MAG: DUF120 domain-containing protein [Thermoplasmata archaeon]